MNLVARSRLLRRTAAISAWAAAGLLAAGLHAAADVNLEDTSAWASHALTLDESVAMALNTNASIRQAHDELEASYGLSMEIRSIALPQLKASGDYTGYNAKNVTALVPPIPAATHRWMANIRVVQSVYEGGRIRSSLRASTLNRQQAVARYQALVANTVFEMRTAYFDVLLAEVQAGVEDSAVALTAKQRDDVKSRIGSGLDEQYDALHAEVMLASARSRQIRGQNLLHLARAKLVHLLGYSIPAGVWDAIPLRLADPLDAPAPYAVELPEALEQALRNRPEIEAQAKAVPLAREHLTEARSGYLPSVQVLGGYGGFNDDVDRDIHGFFGGAQVNWNIFDGLETLGKVREAKAKLDAAESGLRDLKRTVAMEVQDAYSSFVEAKQLLESQNQVQAMNAEGARLAAARFKQGNLSQLQELAAENDLSEARLTSAQSYRDYKVAIAGLQRAMGVPIEQK